MKHIIYIILATILLASCHTTTQVVTETDTTDIQRLEHKVLDYETVIDSLIRIIMRQDSTSHYQSQRDSTYSRLWQTENLTIQDSVYEKEFPDGSRLREVWHNATRTITQHDTLYKYKDNTQLINEYHTLCDLTEHLQLQYQAIHDSLTNLRDSISNATHVEEKVVTPSSWLRDILTSLLVIIAVTLFAYFIFRGDISKLSNK